MSSVNKVILMGNLTSDPEARMTASGQGVASFGLATNESYMKDGQRQQKAEFHRCVAWGKTGELVGKYLKKGRRVYVEGKLQTRSWDGKDGQKRYATEIVVRELVFVDSGDKKDGGNQGGRPQAQQGGYNRQPDPQYADDRDVPF